MSRAERARLPLPVRLLVAFAAAATWICNREPLLELRDGALAWPALAAGGFEELFWLALFAADLAWHARTGRTRLAIAGVALLLAAATLADDARLPLPGDAAWRLPAPVAWSPDAADWELVSAPGSELPAPPSARHWLGTDEAGRDVAARLVHGVRTSLLIGACAAALALAIGVAVGALCGGARGWIDALGMRVIEVIECFPFLFLVLVVSTFAPRGRGTLIALLGSVTWTGIARVVRGEFLRLSGEEFVLAARALGASGVRIARVHLLPNACAPLWPIATFAVSNALLAEFTLSWLGCGIPAPAASLGGMLADGQGALARGEPWLALLPCAAIVGIVLAFHGWGERLRLATTPEALEVPR